MGLFNIGVANIDFSLNKQTFYEKEEIIGNTKIQIKKEVESNGVKAKLWAEITERHNDDNNIRRLYEKEIHLGSSGTMTPTQLTQNYEFKFTIPEGILKKIDNSNGLLSGVKNHFDKNYNKNIRWFISVRIDIPGGRDVNKQTKIFVNPSPLKEDIY